MPNARCRRALPSAGGFWSASSRLYLSLALLALLLAPARSAARTWSVPGDASTIAGAVELAQSGDLILVGCGVYREHDIVLKAGVKLWSGRVTYTHSYGGCFKQNSWY